MCDQGVAISHEIFRRNAVVICFTEFLKDAPRDVWFSAMCVSVEGDDVFASAITVIVKVGNPGGDGSCWTIVRSEEHTSELQSRFDIVCRLLLEKKICQSVK